MLRSGDWRACQGQRTARPTTAPIPQPNTHLKLNIFIHRKTPLCGIRSVGGCADSQPDIYSHGFTFMLIVCALIIHRFSSFMREIPKLCNAALITLWK
jgi:hypothetical protein